MRKCFSFDPDFITLNNGAYGSLPSPVEEAIKPIARLAEANPDLFHRFTAAELTRAARERLAQFIRAPTDEVVFVPNASHGLNTILRNFIWEKGDIIITCNTTYNSIASTVQYIVDTPPHPENSQFTILFPTSHAEILTNWRRHLQTLNATRAFAHPQSHTQSKSGSESAESTLTTRRPRIVAIIDSIISLPGALLPWKEMVQICKEQDVWSVVDAAHSIGQENDLNMAEASPDFWVSNCHKWLFAKRSCAVMYVPKRNQHVIQTTFPTSYAYVSLKDRSKGSRFVEQFEWNSTVDFIPYISSSAALDFRQWLGGEEVINTYCHRIAIEGGKRLAEILGTEVLDEAQGGEFTLNMVNVSLPFPPNTPASPEINMAFRKDFLIKHKIGSAFFYHNEKWWTRCSAQIWSEVNDFEILGKAILEACEEITRRYFDPKSQTWSGSAASGMRLGR